VRPWYDCGDARISENDADLSICSANSGGMTLAPEQAEKRVAVNIMERTTLTGFRFTIMGL
jgi:hypothetical protein